MEGALFAVLEFYEQLVQQELIPADVLTYQTPADYRPEFLSDRDRARVAVFGSTEYLSMLDQQDMNLYASNIPTATGENLATRDGWLWVIITPDQTRQTLSARFLEWMTEPAFHAEFAKALYQLPTQPAILRDSLPITSIISSLKTSCTRGCCRCRKAKAALPRASCKRLWRGFCMAKPAPHPRPDR